VTARWPANGASAGHHDANRHGLASDDGAPRPDGTNQATADDVERKEQRTPAANGAASVLAHRLGDELDLNPEGLEMSAADHAMLQELAPLLSPSPRSIKRFVNTHRLISVGMSQHRGGDSAADPTDAQIRMVLLAILVGMPELSWELQEAIGRLGGPSGQPPTVQQVMDAYFSTAPEPRSQDEAARRMRAAADWTRVRKWLQSMGRSAIGIDRVVDWIDEVGRYTFNLSRSSQILRQA
jgi:hypothetical protein